MLLKNISALTACSDLASKILIIEGDKKMAVFRLKGLFAMAVNKKILESMPTAPCEIKYAKSYTLQ